MTDIRDQFDKAITALGRFSLLAQLRDKVVEASQIGRSECGNCFFWMKSSACPREHNVNGRQTGPTMSDPPCSKFTIKQSTLDLKAQRLAEAVAFATKHDLPIPSAPNDKKAASPG